VSILVLSGLFPDFFELELYVAPAAGVLASAAGAEGTSCVAVAVTVSGTSRT
jgi:hypothetical protein